jgi:hypothetical protein
MTGLNPRAGSEIAGSIDRVTSDAILRRVAELSGLAPQISSMGAPTGAKDLEVFVISPDGRAITTEDTDLVEVAVGQVDRELIAEAVRDVQAQQPDVPPIFSGGSTDPARRAEASARRVFVGPNRGAGSSNRETAAIDVANSFSNDG